MVTYINDAALAQSYIEGLLARQPDSAPVADVDSTTTPVVVPCEIAHRIPAVAEELNMQHKMSEMSAQPCNSGAMAYRAARRLCPEVANDVRKAVRRSGQNKHDFNDVANESCKGSLPEEPAPPRISASIRTETGTSLRMRSPRCPPDTKWQSLRGPLLAGQVVKLVSDVNSIDKLAATLGAGLVGVVQLVDDEGDAEVLFPGLRDLDPGVDCSRWLDSSSSDCLEVMCNNA